jgi:putative ABC transport system permease protein
MRLERLNNITAATLDKKIKVNDNDAKNKDSINSTFGRRSLFSREYRVTFRDTLTSSEKITKGKWTGTIDTNENFRERRIYISLEERFAKRNNIMIGDTMVFNVQGTIMPVIVGSFREVDFNRIETNFLVVFPKGVLEEAPQFYVLLTRIEGRAASARFQQLVVKQFPNVSIIDLSLVLSVLNQLLSKIAFIIRFMAGFSILTGLIVLIASVLTSKYQVIRESVLLRTLGASRKQIFYITALEYFFLGALAAFTGILLSLGFSWGIAIFVFKTYFTPQVLPLLVVFIAICGLTVIIGLLNSREVVRRSPLEILREEG